MREPLPAAVKDLDVHGAEGGESLWPAGYVELPKVCAEEALVRLEDRSVLLRTPAADQERHVGLRGGEPGKKVAVFHSSFREFRISGGAELLVQSI